MINADVQAALRHLAEVKDSFLAAIDAIDSTSPEVTEKQSCDMYDSFVTHYNSLVDTIVTLAATDMRSRCHTE